MADTTTKQLFTPAGTDPGVSTQIIPNTLGSEMTQNEKEAILRQIHPIFLTTHAEEKTPVNQSNFDKFLGFLRLCLEGFLKLIDIIMDGCVQLARLFVWIIAISGVLIVVTLMTNTTDAFIDILNGSVFRYFGINKQIEKIPSETTTSTSTDTTTLDTSSSPAENQNLNSSVLATETETPAQAARRIRKEKLESEAKAAAAKNSSENSVQ